MGSPPSKGAWLELVRGITEQLIVQQKVDAANEKWSGFAMAWDAITWALARDPRLGAPATESGTTRAFHYDGAASIGQPDVDVLYTYDQTQIVIEDVEIKAPKIRRAGRA